MELHEDRARASSFGAEAALYDRVRPSYPAALVDDLCAANPSSVLDVGCGTGIASRLFAARGCEVLGVEQDARMAEVARAHGVDVDVAPFEDWTPRGEPFDLLISGQAWHWIDPERGRSQAARVLRPGGRFAAFWNVSAHEREIKDAMVAIYQRHELDLARHAVVLGIGPAASTPRAGSEGFADGPDFTAVEWRTYEWTRRYGRDEWLDQMQTHSDHAALPRPTLDALLADIGALIDERGGAFDVGYRTGMLTAVRAVRS